jgi:hypothetical protein
MNHRWDACWHPEANELLAPLTYAAENPLSDARSTDDLADEFLGALAALGGSAGNGRLRETLEWDEASYEAVKVDLQSRRLIVPGRGRGGSVALADGSELEASSGTRAASAPSSFDQAFRAIDDCLRKEAGCGTELDYTEQTSWLLFLKYLDGLEGRPRRHGPAGGPQPHADSGGDPPLEQLGRAKGRQRTAGSQHGAYGR